MGLSGDRQVGANPSGGLSRRVLRSSFARLYRTIRPEYTHTIAWFARIALPEVASSPVVVHCIGDSHASFFSGRDTMVASWPGVPPCCAPPFRAYRLGPVLAYSLGRRGSSTQARELLFTLLITEIARGSYVMLCFGEIDCRTQIVKQAARRQTSVEQVARALAARYFAVAKEVEALGYNVMIWNIVPTTRAEVLGEYTTVGTWPEREVATRTVNDTLKRLCGRAGMPFVSIFDTITISDGSPDPRYFMDEIHLRQTAMPAARAAVWKALRGSAHKLTDCPPQNPVVETYGRS